MSPRAKKDLSAWANVCQIMAAVRQSLNPSPVFDALLNQNFASISLSFTWNFWGWEEQLLIILSSAHLQGFSDFPRSAGISMPKLCRWQVQKRTRTMGRITAWISYTVLPGYCDNGYCDKLLIVTVLTTIYDPKCKCYTIKLSVIVTFAYCDTFPWSQQCHKKCEALY